MATQQMDQTQVIDETITMTESRIELGYRNSRKACRTVFKDFVWASSNLPSKQRRGLMALGDFLIECIDLLDLESIDGTPLDVWHEVRSDLHESLAGRASTPTRAALADTVDRFSIPQDHLFQMLDGADFWIRNRRFETFEDTSSFAQQLGGGMMAACVPVLGFTDDGYEDAAIKCGEAIHMTQMLVNLVADLKEHKSFLANEDYGQCGVDKARLQMRKPGTKFRHFVRQYTSRIEKRFIEGSKLLGYLHFSGARTLSSILDCHWAMFCKMRTQPEMIFGSEVILTRKDKFKLRTRHVMGLEGKSPVVDQAAH